MKIITRASLARDAAERWWRHYGRDDCAFRDRPTMYGRTGRETWRALLALGADPTPGQVDAIIGNQSWTDTPRCNGCGRYGEERVVGLEAPGDDDDTGGVTYLCAECVGACAELLGSKR